MPDQPPLQSLALRIELTPDDMPEDRFSNHVNNARYFAFINRTFMQWYVKMGIRVKGAPYSAMMVRTEYDFIEQVFLPGVVECRIRVDKVGRTSMQHAVEVWNVTTDTPAIAGRGRVTHVWVERATARATPWPAEFLARCWSGADDATTGGG